MAFAFQKSESNYIVEIKKSSKLFDAPSSKAKIIGAAEEGTYLIFLEKSMKGLWIKVQDAEGVSGWLPKNRTDYGDIESSVSDSTSNSTKLRNNQRKNNEKDIEETNTYDDLKYRLSLFYIINSRAESPKSFSGIGFDLGLPSISFEKTKNKVNFFSIEAGMPSGFGSLSNSYMGAFRFGMKTPVFNRVFYGLDYGYLFEKRSSIFKNHFSLGLSLGLILSRFDLKARFGYDMFSRSSANVGVQLGCLF